MESDKKKKDNAGAWPHPLQEHLPPACADCINKGISQKVPPANIAGTKKNWRKKEEGLVGIEDAMQENIQLWIMCGRVASKSKIPA